MSKQDSRDLEDYCERIGVTECDLCEKKRMGNTENCIFCGYNPDYHNFFEMNKVIGKVRGDLDGKGR